MEEEILKTLVAGAGIAAVAAILLLVTYKHIRDVYKFLRDPQKFILSEYGEVISHVITETCKRLGLIGLQEHLKSVRLLEIGSLDLPDWAEHYRERFMQMISPELEKISAVIGANQKHHYDYYLNLRRALTDPGKAEELGYVMIAFVHALIKEKRVTFDYIGVNRSGSTILGYILSSHFGRGLLLINKYSRWQLGAKTVFVDGSYTEQNAGSKPEAILIDDSCSGGGSLLEAASRLRDEGIAVHHAIVLFMRAEANAEERLAEAGIKLHAITRVSDKELGKMIASPHVDQSAEQMPSTPLKVIGQTSIDATFPRKLHRLNLYVTLACPLRCKHCCVGPMLDAKEMSLDDAVRYMRAASRNGDPEEIMILGGEPTIYRHLEQVVEAAAGYRNAQVSLCTSGVGYHRILGLSKWLHHVDISLDGFSSETHDKVRRQGAYKVAMEAIEFCLANRISVHLLLTANALNIKEIPDGLEDMARRGVQAVNFHVISETGFAKQNNSLLLDPREWVAMRSTLDNYSGPLKIRYPLKYLTVQEAADERKRNYKCMLAEINRLNILPGGKSYACCLFLDSGYPVAHVIGDTVVKETERATEESFYMDHPGNSCPAETLLLGHDISDLVPVCVHWKRRR